MKKVLGAAIVVAATAFAGTAMAEGFYFGAHVGDMKASSQWTDVDGDWHTGSGPNRVGTFDGNNFVYGAQAGYDMAFDNVVLGIVADYTEAGINDRYTKWGFDGGASCGCVLIQDKMNYAATLRARAGYNFNGVMPFVTIGYGWTDMKHTWIESGDPTDSWPGFAKKNSVVYGGGVEFDAGGNWSIAGEGLYFDQGTDTSTNLDGFRMSVRSKVIEVRMDVNYHLPY